MLSRDLFAVCQKDPKDYTVTRGGGGNANERYISRRVTPRHSGKYYFWDSSHHLAHPERTGNPYSQVRCFASLCAFQLCLQVPMHDAAGWHRHKSHTFVRGAQYWLSCQFGVYVTVKVT